MEKLSNSGYFHFYQEKTGKEETSLGSIKRHASLFRIKDQKPVLCPYL
jgi:hypothetical protein